MSIKKYFEIAENIQSLSNKSAAEIADQVESVGYQEQDIIEEERFIPHVDFSKPGNFARYGSAVSYYKQALERVYNTYPYDGSLKERLQWVNESTYLDLYIFDNRYPRTNGYVVLTADGYGSVGAMVDGYGPNTDSADYEYIHIKGGPNVNPDGMSPLATAFTGSNYYEPTKNRGSNLEFDLDSNGATIEFWLKKDEFITGTTEKEVIFDMWNGVISSSADYTRLRVELTGAADGLGPFRLTAYSGSTGFFDQSISSTTFTTASVADGNWHHYAVSMKSAGAGVTTRFYVDGRLNNKTTLGTAGVSDAENTSLQAYIGALIGAPSGSTATAGAGKLSGSLDEFRYWKTQRTSQDIGRFWFTQVGGGVNSDPTPFIETSETANVDLGVYFKFNEGITGVTATDSVILDFSGRYSNGAWTGYGTSSRNTGSAIVSSGAAIKEFKDPIIYSFHPLVVSLAAELELSGSEHDVNNNASMYGSIPSWITEDDDEGSGDTKKLTQILSSYFDTLHLQIGSLNKIKDISYPSGSNKPIPFAERFLGAYGFVAPNLFVDADVLEKLADRSENKVFEKSLHDIKNTIYQNIYNNLNYIYKSKGTEKAFRNLIRCFGIDDELVKINMYADNIEYEMRNSRRNVIVTDRFVNFNTPENQHASVYNYEDTSNANSVSFIPAVTSLTAGYSYTLETELLMPKKLDQDSTVYFNTNVLSASLFGIHGTNETAATTWPSPDRVNFQVYALRDELYSDNVKFMLTGTAGGFVPHLESPLYEGVYDNTRWNLSVRVRPENYPVAGLGTALGNKTSNGNYVVELHGIQAEAGDIMQEFTVSGTVTAPPAGFVTGSRRVYIGAHRQDFSGNVLKTCDVKVNACRFWLDYLDDETLQGHILDTENHGALQPHLYAFPFDTSGSNGYIAKFDSLVFNWEFLTNTGSNASQQFVVDDLSSGSAAFTRFGNLGPILNKQYTGLGNDFLASSTTPIDKDFVVSSKINLPGNMISADMIKVLSTQEQNEFTSETRPTNFYFAFEKSMYQVISEEMINYFANLKDLHNLIGDSVEKYRPEYKQLNFLRQKFFEKVANDTLDFDRFYEFYKWFDSSLSTMLQQLVPASADFSENVRTMIESHLLERPKYRRIFPFLERVGATDITASFSGINIIDSTAGGSPDDLPAGTLLFSNTSPTKRQIGSSNPTQISNWKHVHAPAHPIYNTTYDYYNTYYVAYNQQLGLPQNVGYNIAIDTSWTTPTAFTFAGWVKYPTGDAVDGTRTWFQFGEAGYRLAELLYTGEIRFGVDWTLANGQWTTTDASLSGDSWRHIAICYDGSSTSNVPVIYVDGVAKTMTTNVTPNGTIVTPGPHGGHGAIIGSILNSSGMSLNQCFRDGEIATMSLWGKKLSAPEVAEIYNKTTGFAPATGFNPGPQNLTTHSAYSDLISWWRFGIDESDDFTADSVKDQKGSNDAIGNGFITGTPPQGVLTTLTSADNAVIGGGTYTATTDYQENKNVYWWRYVAERSDLPLSNSLNPVRADLLNSIRRSYDRRVGAPYRFDAEGCVTFGGVGRPPINRPNALFPAIEPFGPVISGSNIPTNIMISFDTDVENLIETVDEYHPTFKQRLGFSIDPSINTLDPPYDTRDLKNNGNLYAPFSLYSSSVTTGYNAEVAGQWKSGTMITNLHNDFVADHDVPAQGPFTEKFVGGRKYRHTEINPGTDTRESRAEGFRLTLGLNIHDTTGYTGALGIVPANYPFSDTLPGDADLGYLPDLPMAYRFRDETAKRAVNIKNILMTSASVGTRLSGTIMHNPIGNYQKNYQVINTGGRMINDPFFQDQSFDFALYPETAIGRTRRPMELQRVTNTKSVYFDGTNDYLSSSVGAPAWNNIIGGANADAKAFTFSAWVRPVSMTDSYPRIIDFGGGTFPDRTLAFYGAAYPATAQIYLNSGQAMRSSAASIVAGQWVHIVGTYAGGSSGDINIYVNGVKDNATHTDLPDTTAITTGLTIGADPDGPDEEFNGYVNDVAIWSRALTESEVGALYNNGYQPDLKVVLNSGLVSWYRMGDGDDDTNTTIYDQMGFANLTAVNGPTIQSTAPNLIVESSLNFALPDRTGANSNQTVIVNRFSAPGDYKTLSRGYLDPAHEELSVYNAAPYRNREVIDFGFQGSASLDPSIQGSIRVVDQIGKNRGLNQLASLHCGPFGSDAAYGSVPSDGYVTVPSWTKNNRNRKKEIQTFEIPTYGWFNGDVPYGNEVEAGDTSTWDALIGLNNPNSKSFSLSFWINLDSRRIDRSIEPVIFYWTGGIHVWLEDNSSTMAPHLVFWRAPDSAGSDPGLSAYGGTSELQPDRWHHIVATFDTSQTFISAYDGSTIQYGDWIIYVDGKVVRDVDIPSYGPTMPQRGYEFNDFTNANKFTIGNDTGWDNFGGGLTNIGIWQRVLTEPEAITLSLNPQFLDRPVPDQGTLPDSMIAYYTFNPLAGDTETSIINRAPSPAAGTDGDDSGTFVELVNGTNPTGSISGDTAAPSLRLPYRTTGSLYDNLFVQHAIPRSEQQYAWVNASLKSGETIYGLDAPSCASASVMDTQITSSAYPYYNGQYSISTTYRPNSNIHPGDPWNNNFVGYMGNLLVDPASTSTHVLGVDGLDTATAGSPSGEFFGRESGSAGANSSVVIGYAADWESFIGGATYNGKPFAFIFWMYPRSTGGTVGNNDNSRVIDICGQRRMIVSNAGSGDPDAIDLSFSIKRDASAGSGYYQLTSRDIPLNKWTHIVASYDGGRFSPASPVGDRGTMQIYRNGVLDIQSPATCSEPNAINNTYQAMIGNVGTATYHNHRGFDGFLTDVAVYNNGTVTTTVTGAQIPALYNGGRPRLPTSALGADAMDIIALYTFSPSARTPSWDRLPDGTPFENVLQGDQIYINTDGTVTTTIYNRCPQDDTKPWPPHGTGSAIYLSRFSPNSIDSLNILTNNRHGPYGWPTWKQIRTGETKVARLMRKNNLIGTTIVPNKIPNIINGKTVGFIQPTQPNDFIDFVEAPISQDSCPFYFYFEDNTEEANPENNIMLKAPSFSNEYDYFSHEQLNNRLGLKIDLEQPKVYDSIVDFALNSDLSLMMNYNQRIWPSAESAFRATVRGRTAYDINNIYNSSRVYRSLRYGGQRNTTQGQPAVLVASSSTWPLDAHLDYSTTASVTASDGSGELMNLYGTWQQNAIGTYSAPWNQALNHPTPRTMPTYALRVPAGQSEGSVGSPAGDLAFGGDTEWVAPIQAGKDPYKNYTLISDRIRSVAKDYSILPEFRISDHMKYFIEDSQNDFLAPLDNVFELSGAAVSSSLDPTFYRTYTNADFLKYFKVVDEDLNEKRTGNLQIVRDKVSLKCDAVLKFVPYKGFYPAERTLEIAGIFSQSYGPSLMYLTGSHTSGQGTYVTISGSDAYRLRPLMEPLMSPGILFNTIKSGLATSDVVVVGPTNKEGVRVFADTIATGSQLGVDADGIYYGSETKQLQLPTVLWFGSGSGCQVFDSGAGYGPETGPWDYATYGTMLTKLPFEALYGPAKYFNAGWLGSRATVGDLPILPSQSGQCMVYDRWPSGSNAYAALNNYTHYPSFAAAESGLQNTLLFTGSLHLDTLKPYVNRSGSVLDGPLYIHAIDNFLCETTNMFMSNLTNFQSAREEDFRSVVAGTEYTMVIRMYRSNTATALLSSSAFEMYSRRSAFGPPVGASARPGGAYRETQVGPTGLSFSHVTPPYYDGEARATFTFSPAEDGFPTLNDIITNTTLQYHRDEKTENLNAALALSSTTGDPNADVRMQIDSSFNLLERMPEIPDGTVTLKDRWLIQSKFETPMLNFAGVETGSVPKETYTKTAATSSAAQIETRGMWHQYGSQLTSSAGVWITLEDGPGKSLADVVGFKVGTPQRIGEPKKEYKLEEAIVAVPFRISKNRREFIKFPQQDVRIVSEDGKLLESYTQPDPRSQTYKNLAAAMDKYVFPPRFNFVDFDTVDAVLMYIFEFSAKLTQKDITDMWQNLPPELGETFEHEETAVEEKELVDLILDKDDGIRWMVFKVKRKAQKDFEVYRRSLVTDNVSAMTPRITSPYSYNWPYDYFSLIELAKIEEEVQYVSVDMKEGTDLTEAELLTITKPDPAGRVPPKQPPGTTAKSIIATARKSPGPTKKPRKPSKKPRRSPTKPKKRLSGAVSKPKSKKSGVKTVTKVLKKSTAKSKVKKRTRRSRYGKK